MADRRRPTPPVATPPIGTAREDSSPDEPTLTNTSAFREESADPDEIGAETNALPDPDLQAMLAEERLRHSDEVTMTLSADELDRLRAQSRIRSSMATIPDGLAEIIAKTHGQKSDPPPAPPPPDPPPLAIMPAPFAPPPPPAASFAAPAPPYPAPAAPPPAIAASPAAFATPPPAFATPPPAPAAPPPTHATAPTSAGAWAVAQPETPNARPALASVPDWAGPSLRPNRKRLFALIGGGVALLGIILFLVLSDSEPSAESSAGAPSATEAPAPPPPPPPKAADPTPSQAETEAREALTRLREGMGDCIRHGIGTLPGSSPAIPASLKMVKTSGYMPVPTDWKTAVWSCARFRVTSPMRFQVQWQLVKPNVEGLGVVWIDENGDGTADRALGFRATLKARRDPVLAEIAPVDATLGVIPVP